MRLFSFGTPGVRTTADDVDVLRLIRSRRVGPATFHRLTAEHGSVAAALAALPQIAAAAGVRDYAPCPPGVAQAELRAGQRMGARLLRYDAPDYPPLLRTIPDAPPVLWCLGDPAMLTRPAVAVIGARNASSLGLRMAQGMAHGLSQAGLVVTAGLARGIDTAAHKAALEGGTVAVLATGLDSIYPAENTTLAARIAETGCLLTEQPFGTKPAARHFPARNRIVSGLCAATVVVEAAQRSGSLITARLALDQGREVMAVPGHPMDARASGCNALIRDGAALVRHSGDVLAALAELGIEPAAAAGTLPDPTPEPVLSPAPQAPPADLRDHILSQLSPSPTDEDWLIRHLAAPPAAATAMLTALELEGRITRMSGGKLALTG
ncbi:MAG: DNA-processing protein DprA [Paracoccus sp. (in: a-proteobacteria)]|uniref:DNA-processing protein DprA n=1 Tax=Paracoccus sp. TaxID=267 RepID=UPI0026DF4EA6|nr:DNA-processing protein DprA [Paracoccus sp. (in: a-proteobacteria)]MDO5620063.1 DNA-processing protein DprA [Paracoccus sp. (in: a-proteobacteria)]